MRVIPNGVDLSNLHLSRRRTTNRRRLFDDRLQMRYSDQLVLLTTSRLVRIKRIADMLAANHSWFDTNRDRVVWLIVGDGPERDRLAAMIQQFQLPNVRLVGRVDHSEIEQFYHAADFCAMPSQFETFGISAIEGMAAGCLPIVSPHGGLAEIVLDGITGFHLPPDLQLRWLLDCDASKLAAMREKAFAMAEQRYCWSQVAKQTLDVYDEVSRQSVCHV